MSCCDCPLPPSRPIALRAVEGRDGWQLNFELPPYEAYTDVFVRYDDRPEVNTGHERTLNVMTGKPQARSWTIVPPEWAAPGTHRLSLRLAGLGGRVDRRVLLFDADRERLTLAKRDLADLDEDDVSFSEHGQDVTWLAFTHVYSHRQSLREVLYSVNTCALDRRIAFATDPAAEPTLDPAPAKPNDLILDRPFLTLPKASTWSACVQVVFDDGTRSRRLEIHRQASGKP